MTRNFGKLQTLIKSPTFFSRSGVWKVSRNFLTWSFLSWSMLRASMARPRNSSTSSSGFRASWIQRLWGGWNNRSLVCFYLFMYLCVSVGGSWSKLWQTGWLRANMVLVLGSIWLDKTNSGFWSQTATVTVCQSFLNNKSCPNNKNWGQKHSLVFAGCFIDALRKTGRQWENESKNQWRDYRVATVQLKNRQRLRHLQS